jgi:hypothetical protein
MSGFLCNMSYVLCPTDFYQPCDVHWWNKKSHQVLVALSRLFL